MKKYFSVLLSVCMLFCTLASISCSTVNAATYNIDFETTSKSIYLENLDTETVVYRKDSSARRFPASTTKIMTYVITSEHVPDPKNTYLNVKGEVLDMLLGTGSSMAGLEENEKVSIYQLLCCMMIPSGNDAALILADYVGNGDIDKFVDLMNSKAQSLGCEDTHFSNPHGLNDPNHYTTVEDMAKITK